QHDPYIGGLRQRRHIGVTLESGYRVDFRVDRIDGTIETMLAQVRYWPPGSLGWIRRRANHRHTAGVNKPENCMHGVHTWALRSSRALRKAWTDSRCSADV